MDHAQRLELAYAIGKKIKRHYGSRLVALGVYGSLARGTDQPYSDIEMHCVVQGSGVDKCYEWSTGSWKAEVDVYSEDVLLNWAADVDFDWALTHGACTDVLVIEDRTDFFTRLRETAVSQSDDVFTRAKHDIIVGEIMEFVGKVRNACAGGNSECLSRFAVKLAERGALLLGLANRHLYVSSSNLLGASLALPERPDGYDCLCKMVMLGELTDPAGIASSVERFWTGVEQWAGEHNIRIRTSLDMIL
jgi:kanamycin nucleotidyltransferase